MKWLIDVVEWNRRNWMRPEGLSVILVIASVGLVSLLGIANIGGSWVLVALLLLWLSAVTVWIQLRRVPRTRRGKLGFVVCISHDENTAPAIRTDFVLALRRELYASPSSKSFHVIEVPNYIAEKTTNEDDARRLRLKLRAHFVLLGRVRHRKLSDGVDHEILDLIGLVSHGPMPADRAQQLKKEFTELLPSRYQIKTSDSFHAVEFTATWAGVIAKYIIGMAAGMSGDLQYAENLLNEVKARITVANQGFLFYAKIKERIPTILTQIAFAKAQTATSKWFRSKSEEDLIALEEQLDFAVQQGMTSDGFATTHAIVNFFRTRNTAAPRRHFARISRKNRDAVWHLNMAFLDAFDGDLSSAARHYRSASSLGVPDADVDITVGQIEHFLEWQLEIDPNLVEMHFCLGYVNMHLKGDAIQASRDFERFLERCPPDRHEREQVLVRGWLDELRETK